MSKNLEETQVVQELFNEHFEEWADNDLPGVLDETFDKWSLNTDSEDGVLLIHVKLNDVDEYGEDLDAFLEYQVLGIKFLDSLGLRPEVGYEMSNLLEVLSSYILVYPIKE